MGLALKNESGKLSIVIDTDTFNEIDDQFALVYSLANQGIFDLKAVFAAPYFHQRVSTPLEGMLNSYDEILKIFRLYGIESKGKVFKGADRFTESSDDAVESEAVERLIQLANEQKQGPLYVIAIAAATNIASAIRLCPSIIEKIVVVWLGGHPYEKDSAKEFNLMQDVSAAQTLFDSGISLVHVPCEDVARKLTCSRVELLEGLKDCSEIGRYLFKIFSDYLDLFNLTEKTIWDIAAVAYLINAEWLKSKTVSSPVLTDQMKWTTQQGRHNIVVVEDLDHKAIFADFFAKLKLAKAKKIKKPAIVSQKVKSPSTMKSAV